MKTLEYDLCYVSAGLEILEKYLLSGEVFWPIHASPSEGEPEYPKLALDGLLLACTRIMSYRKTSGLTEQVEQVLSTLEYHRKKWRVAWNEKAWQCFKLRERMWGNFLQEYQDNPQENADRYVYEIRLRVMLELLKSEIDKDDDPAAGMLSGLDDYLKRTLEACNFIWDAEIQSGFPENVYWYLYGKLVPILKNY